MVMSYGKGRSVDSVAEGRRRSKGEEEERGQQPPADWSSSQEVRLLTSVAKLSFQRKTKSLSSARTKTRTNSSSNAVDVFNGVVRLRFYGETLQTTKKVCSERSRCSPQMSAPQTSSLRWRPSPDRWSASLSRLRTGEGMPAELTQSSSNFSNRFSIISITSSSVSVAEVGTAEDSRWPPFSALCWKEFRREH